jgi:hypothetical protein
VSDALSRDYNRSDEELTEILRTFVPEQIPPHFEIVPLPNEISSWLISVLQKLPVKMQLQEQQHTKTKLGCGVDGKSTPIPSVSLTTSTLMDSKVLAELNSWEPLPWLSGKDASRDQLMIPWSKAQSEIPFLCGSDLPGER